MIIMYLSYWGVNDGLTVSVIYPHLHILQESKDVDKIIFVTIERDSNDAELNPTKFSDKVDHHPLHSKNLKLGLINKVNDFVLFPKLLKRKLKSEKVDVAFTHGMVSGSLLHLVCPKMIVPYYVFAEPHSEYMLESGVWKKNDPRYLFQKKWEEGQLRTAEGIFSVTENYIARIRNEYPLEISNKAKFAPNAVDLELFEFNEEERVRVRKDLGITDDEIVGIYVGKFGGIYLKEEAFKLFKIGEQVLANFKLVILSPQSEEEIRKLAEKTGYAKNVIVRKVPHELVRDYLFAADFGISIQNPKPSNLFLCPLKNGEYWASGLPIFSIKDVGDDTKRIEHNPDLGAVFTLGDHRSVERAFKHIAGLCNNKSNRISNPPRKAAEKYKNLREAGKLIQQALDKVNLPA